MDNDSPYMWEMSDAPCDGFDLKENVLGESCHLDGGTGGLVVAKDFGIDAVDGVKVVQVLQEHLSPHTSVSVKGLS